jgi:hypothetical protein
MAMNAHGENRHSLDSEQRIDAKQMIGCGWTVPDTARHYGLSEENLRIQLGMPVWRQQPMDRQRKLFDSGGYR